MIETRLKAGGIDESECHAATEALELSKTIAMARGVLSEGRLHDAARMIEPLIEPDAGSTGGPLDASQIALRCLMARICLIGRGNSARAWELLKRFDLGDDREPLDPALRGEVALWLGWIRAWQDDALFDGARALNLLDEAARLFRAQPDPGGLCWALLGQAYAYFTIDEYRLMKQALKEAAGLQESLADRYLEAWLCHLLAASARFDGRYKQAHHDIDRLEELGAELDDRLLLGRALAHRAVMGYDQGQQVDEVITLAERAEREIIQAATIPGHSLLAAYQVHVGALIRKGPWDAAARVIDACSERMGHLATARSYILLQRVRLLRLQGSIEEAKILLAEISSGVHRQNRLLAAHISREQCELDLSTGSIERAAAHARDALRFAREAGYTALELEILLLQARVAAGGQDLEAAQRFVREAEGHPEFFSLLPLAALRFQMHGRLAALSGRTADTRAFYAQALTAYSLIGDAYAAAALQLELARQSDGTTSTHPSELAASAAAAFEKLPAAAEADRARQLLEKLPGTSGNGTEAPEQEFGAILARAAVSVELVAEAWLQAAERLAYGRWLVVYRFDDGRWSLVHKHGDPPGGLDFPDPAVERICQDGVDWVRLRGLPAPAFYFGMECGGENDPACAAIEKRLSPWIPVVGLALEHAILRSSRLGNGAPNLWKETSRLSVSPRNFVCASPTMRRLVAQVQRICDGHSPVLITGERGVGKERIARLIHELSSRAEGNFVRFSCPHDAPRLLERVLTADDGNAEELQVSDADTLYLDRIDQLPRELQLRLYRFIEKGAFSADLDSYSEGFGMPRLLASSGTDLRQLVREGSFNEELYYRLNMMPLAVPPLRDRREDIPLLVQYFLRKLSNGVPAGASITSRAVDALVRYDWPGNVRQLRNELERLVAMAASEPHSMIDIEDLSPPIVSALRAEAVLDESDPGKGYAIDGRGLDDILAVAEKSVIEQVLAANEGQVTSTAEALGLSRQGLYKKMKRLGIDASAFQQEASSVQSLSS